MTSIAGWIAAPDRAYAWSDTEIYDRHGYPDGHRRKMAINHEISAVVVACGDTLMLDLAEEATQHASSFESLAERLLPRLAQREWRPAKWMKEGGRFLVVGYAPDHCRMRGYELLADEDFLPRQFSATASSPYVREIDSIRNPREIAAVAKAQMAQVQKAVPNAGGGKVELAEISAGSILQRTIVDFDLDARERRLREVVRMDLAAMGDL